jgi:ubiquinone/menaquinone biosynthesis C-methylase UbiE
MYEWFIRLLKPERGRSLLDISCGEGPLVYLASEMGLRAFGMDFAFWGVKRGQMRAPQAGWSVADGEILPVEDATFDYVTHIGSLEHYLHLQNGANEICRVLKPGGKACIMVPNTFGLIGNIRHVVLTGDVHDDGQPLQRYATRRQWEKVIHDAGLEIEKVIGYEGSMVVPPQHFKDWGWFITHPQRLVRLVISRIEPINLSNHFVFICRRSAA